MRKDSENLAIIERLKPKHAAELSKLIRFEAELERGERDLEELFVELEQRWGTRDLNKIRELVTQNYAANTEAVDQWIAKREAVNEALEALEARG